MMEPFGLLPDGKREAALLRAPRITRRKKVKSSAATAATQLCFDGMERPAEAAWNPVPATLARVKRYFEGYQANDREIFAKRSWIAVRLQMSVRTLARYLAYLRDVGWMATVQRKARTAIRKVLQALRAVPSFVPSVASGPLTDVHREEKPTPRKKPAPETAFADWGEITRLHKSGVPWEEAKRLGGYAA